MRGALPSSRRRLLAGAAARLRATSIAAATIALATASIGCRGADVKIGSPRGEPRVEAPIAFEYDARAPLDLREGKREVGPRATIVDLTYASPRGGRVPSYLVIPRAGAGPFAAVLFVHWGHGGRSELLADAIALAEIGAASILIDAPFARPQALRSPAVQDDRDEYLQAVVDLRRAIDVLLLRPDVDPKRLGYVGHSYGGHLAGVLAGIDPRVRAYVVMAGVASLTDLMRDGDSPDLVALREKSPKDGFDAYLARMSPLDARHFVTRASANTSFLFQYARHDPIVPPAYGPEYMRLVPGKKELRWYEGGHELADPRAAIDRLAWLATELGLPSPVPAWRAMAPPE